MLQILRIIKILNSDANPSAIASAISLAFVLGLTPLVSPHNLLILLIVLLFRVHLGTFFLAALGFSLLGLILEPSLDEVGLAVLQSDTYQAIWTSLYNTQFGRLSFFNYSTTMGGLFVGIVAFIPLWLLSLFVVKQYRENIMGWIEKNKLVQLLKGSAIIQLYNKTAGEQ